MKGRLILALLLLIGGTIFVLVRIIASVVNKQSQNQLIRKIKRKPGEASRYVQQLDMVMGKRGNIDRQVFELIKSKIQSSPTIGDYKILYSILADEGLLFFTELEFTDFDVTFTGNSDNVKKKSHHNFVLRHNSQTQELELSSELYADAISKMQKQEFIDALFKTAL